MRLPFPLTLVANTVIAGVIRANPEVREILSESNGGLIAIELENPTLSLRLLVLANGVQLLGVYDEAPDLQLSADLPALLALADAGHDPILDGRVQAEGDMALATVLQQLIVVLSSDWEGQLAPYIGDAAAHKTGVAARGFSSWLGQTQRRGGEDVGEYLQEEVRVLVTRSEWLELEQQTDGLRERLDRLTARTQQVEA